MANPMLTRVGFLSAEIETTVGVDPVPEAATDWLLAFDPSYTVDPTMLERDYLRPSFSNPPHVIGRKLASLSFSVEIMGSGTAGATSTEGAAAPIWAKLLEGCAMGAANVMTTPYGKAYTPITTGQKTVTIYCYYDGQLHKLTGAMGSFELTAEAGQLGRIQFNFTGNYVAPVATSTPTATPPSIIPPVVENVGFTLGATTGLKVGNFTISSGNNVITRVDANSPSGFNGVMITSRAPTLTITPEADLEATHPFWADLAAGNRKTAALTIGSTNGNKLAISVANTQLTGITYGDRDGIRTYDVNMRIVSTTAAGNDEYSLTFI